VNHDDTLVGEIGDDHLEGGSGNDSLDGDGLHDVCIGGPGTDVFLVCESQTQ
jgi:Ca2+-binding RTX toxin-like protein